MLHSSDKPDEVSLQRFYHDHSTMKTVLVLLMLGIFITHGYSEGRPNIKGGEVGKLASDSG